MATTIHANSEHSTSEFRHRDKLIEISKRISVKEAGAFSFMDGYGLRNIIPYAVAIGASNLHVGLINSLPGLLGNLTQLFTYRAMGVWSRKKISVVCVMVQSFMWFTLLLAGALYYFAGFNNHWPATILIGLYTFLIMTGAFAGPAWNSWMRDLVTKDLGAYFGRRNRIAGFLALVNSLIASKLLDILNGKGWIFFGFVFLFSLAFLGRFISGKFLARQHEPPYKQDAIAYFSFGQFLKKMPRNNFGRFVIFTALFSFSAQISGPFTAVYMLRNLEFSYFQYMLVILSGSLTSLLFLPAWGRFADKFGPLMAIRISTLTVIIIPFLWAIPEFLHFNKLTALIFLVSVQMWGGFLWTGYELSIGNFIFNAVTRQRLALCMSYFGLLNALGALMGALVGSFLASQKALPLSINPIIAVFLLSGVGRMAVALLVGTKVKEVLPVETLKAESAKEFFKSSSISTIKYFESFTQRIIRRTPF